MKRSVKIAIVTLAVSLFSIPMFAVTVASANTNNVTANVVAGCQWVTPLTMAFGTYNPFSGAALAGGPVTLNFKCVKLTNATNTYKIWFSKTGGNMTGIATANLLAYTLTDNAGAALPTTAVTSTTVAGVPGIAGAGYSFIVKGSIAINQDVSVDSYQDTVVSNIEY
jgi:spore coat protein U-like protein